MHTQYSRLQLTLSLLNHPKYLLFQPFKVVKPKTFLHFSLFNHQTSNIRITCKFVPKLSINFVVLFAVYYMFQTWIYNYQLIYYVFFFSCRARGQIVTSLLTKMHLILMMLPRRKRSKRNRIWMNSSRS